MLRRDALKGLMAPLLGLVSGLLPGRTSRPAEVGPPAELCSDADSMVTVELGSGRCGLLARSVKVLGARGPRPELDTVFLEGALCPASVLDVVLREYSDVTLMNDRPAIRLRLTKDGEPYVLTRPLLVACGPTIAAAGADSGRMRLVESLVFVGRLA